MNTQQQKTWLITGTSKGLGLELSKHLLSLWHRVVATSRTPEVLLQAVDAHREQLHSVPMDVTSNTDVRRVINYAVAKFGHLDVVVNNAGYSGFGSDSSCNAAKFGLIGISEALAQEVSQFGIRVTVVAPGQFRTDFMDSLRYVEQRIDGYGTDEAQAKWAQYSGQQAGDPQKLVALLVKLTELPEPPLHLLLGPDTYALVTQHRRDEAEEFEAWKPWTLSTDVALTAYFDDPALIDTGLPTVQYVADLLNVSPNYLSAMLRVLTGQNTQQHIHDKLIERAKLQLSTTRLSVSEIAYALGFEHSQSFSRLFKTKTNRSPLEFRQAYT